MKEVLEGQEGLEQARGWRGGGSSAMDIPLGNISRWNEVSETIDR